MRSHQFNSKNLQFTESAFLNTATYDDYLARLKKIAISIFEWVNLPSSMSSRFIEECLFYNGYTAFLKDSKFGFINTKCSSSGKLNIYGIPTHLHCYSYDYSSLRRVYMGFDNISDNRKKYLENSECILVMNNYDRIPTFNSLQLFTTRLYECQRSWDTNIKAQKTPILILANEKQRYLIQNVYSQYDGNTPVIFGDKEQFPDNIVQSINTSAPFVADKLSKEKDNIWNEALTFLGINNIIEEKKERLTEDESQTNNELINLNLQSFLVPRQEACNQFNEKYGLTGTNKEISVRVRSDLTNIIKTNFSVFSDIIQKEEDDNGILYN